MKSSPLGKTDPHVFYFILKIEPSCTEIGLKEPGYLEQKKSKLCWPVFFFFQPKCFALLTLISVFLSVSPLKSFQHSQMSPMARKVHSALIELQEGTIIHLVTLSRCCLFVLFCFLSFLNLLLFPKESIST